MSPGLVETAPRSSPQVRFGHDFSRIPILRPQAKLAVSQPGDPAEQEAEQVAEKVMRAEAPTSSAPQADKEEDEEPEEKAPAVARTVQRDPDPNAPAPAVVTPDQPPADPLGPSAGGGGVTNFSVKNTTRTVSAPNLSQLWDVLTRTGTREAASVTPNLKPDPQYEYDANDRVSKVVVTAVETKEMPVWSERDAQCPPIQAEWDRVLGVLDAHENHHLAIDTAHFATVHTKLIGKKREAAWAAFDAEVDAANKENDAYDDATHHGVDEGAKINTAVQCAPEKVHSSGTSTLSDNDNATGDASTLPPTAQAKLTVSRSGDPQEQEADRMADHILRMPEATIQRACAGPGHCDCPRCRAEQERRLARAADGNTGVADDAGVRVADVVGRGGGQPLGDSTRAFMEPRFGHDFSQIRIHTDDQAARSAASVQALAYTVGSDVVFGAGQYAPGTPSGDRLLAHELTHTVQQGAAARAVQRDEDPNSNSDANQHKLIDAARKSQDPADVKAINPFRLTLANTEEKFDLIDILINHNSFVGPRDSDFLNHLWNSFGKDLPTVMNDPNHVALWDACNAKWLVDLYQITELTPLKDQFKADIVATVKGFLAENRTFVTQEMQRLGLDSPNAPATAEQTKARQEMTAIAKNVKPMLDYKKRLENLPVGYRRVVDETTYDESVYFSDSPDQPPQAIQHRSDDADWSEVKAHHDEIVATIKGVTDQYPTIYALIRDEKVDDVVKNDDDAKNRQIMSDSLHNVLTKIADTDKTLDDPKSTLPLEMQPIHQQLYGRAPWTQAFPKKVAQKSVEQYKDDKFWEDLGLNTLGAALFVFASVATGGAAIVLVAAAAGISASQAEQSWEKYTQMNAASQTNMSDKTALLSQGQVSAQLVEAVIATVAAFLDVCAAAKEIKSAVGAGDEAAKKLAQAHMDKAEGKLTEAEGKEAKSLAEQQERQWEFVDEVTGEKHTYRMTDHGLELCSHCDLTPKIFKERVNNLAGGAPKEGSALKAETDALEARVKTNSSAFDGLENEKGKIPDNEWNKKQGDLKHEQDEIEKKMESLEREQKARAQTQDEGFSLLKETDDEVRKELKMASDSPCADIVAEKPGNQWRVEESKGDDMDKACKQLEPTMNAVIKEKKAAAGDIELLIDTKATIHARLSGDEGLAGWKLDKDGFLGYTKEDGTFVLHEINGQKIKVRSQ